MLLVILNWFVRKVYWFDWIGRHHRQRKKLLAQTGIGVTLGLILLGFTSVHREGFEVVRFLQNLELKSGSSAVMDGVAIGLAATAVVGVITFWLHHRLPYRKMLVLTGVLVVAVLVVMIGGTALSFVKLGWLSGHATPFTVPEWMGSWFEMYSYRETLGAQVLAGTLAVGSYHLAEYVKVTRPMKQGLEPEAQSIDGPENAMREPVEVGA